MNRNNQGYFELDPISRRIKNVEMRYFKDRVFDLKFFKVEDP